MKAIIFAAGLGTRLKPLTDHCPKALVPLNNKPLLWHVISNLESQGVTDIVVNVHHFGEQIISFLTETQFKARIFISDERHELLDTGGGLLNAKSFLFSNEPIIAFNVDVISSVDLASVVEYHQRHKALATLVVRQRETSRYFMFDKQMKLSGWKNYSTGEEIISSDHFLESIPWAFSGIQVFAPEIFKFITEKGKFSVTPMYLRLAKEHLIMGYPDVSDFWLDLGKPGQIEIAEEFLRKRQHPNKK